MVPIQKILILGHTLPEPDTTAAGCRMLQLIDLFLEYGYQITFASTAIPSERSFNLEALGVATKSIELNNASFDLFLKNENPNVVLFDRFITEEQFGWRVSEICPDALKVLDTEDLHFLRKAREEAYKKGESNESANLFTETAKRELASILRCDISLLISEYEMHLLKNVFNIPEGLLWYIPFLIRSEISEIQKKQQDNFEERANFISIGNLKHPPNVAAVKILKHQIWPELRQKFPLAQLHIYGAYAPQHIQQMNNPNEGFLIKGWAHSVSEVMQQARIQLAPIAFGAGLKGKLIDAMQYGLPTVTTPVGSEGIYGNIPESSNITSSWEQFCHQAALLYQQRQRWSQVQQQGYEVIARRFQKKQFDEPFAERLRTLQSCLSEHRNKHFIGQILQYKTLQASKYLSKWIEEKERLK